MRTMLAGAALAIVCITSSAVAKEGFYLGGFFQATMIDGDSQDAGANAYFNSLDAGGGFGLRGGYRFTALLAIEASLFASFHGTDLPGIPEDEYQDFTGETVNLKFIIPLSDGNIEPYLSGGVGAYQIGDSGDVYYRGTGYQYGLGVDIFASPVMSITCALTAREITFNAGDYHAVFDTKADAITIDVGITYHFR